jgi:hypothetical protein
MYCMHINTGDTFINISGFKKQAKAHRWWFAYNLSTSLKLIKFVTGINYLGK